MGYRILQNSFTGGEISPSMLGRTDNGGYKTGASRLENFVPLPQGMLRSRPGFSWVCELPNTAVKLIPFRFSSTQTYVLVFTDRQVRIATQGTLITANGSPYVIASPYPASALQSLDYSQVGDVLTLTNPNYPPKELVRYGITDWRFSDVQTGTSLSAPTGVHCWATWAAHLSEADEKDKNNISARYVVTAVDANDGESMASSPASGTGNYYINGCYIHVGWNAVQGAVRYRVYREVAGIWGFIGSTSGVEIADQGNNPDTSDTPPYYEYPFAVSRGYVSNVEIKTAGNNYPANSNIPISFSDAGNSGSGASGYVRTNANGVPYETVIQSGGDGYISPVAVINSGHAETTFNQVDNSAFVTEYTVSTGTDSDGQSIDTTQDFESDGNYIQKVSESVSGEIRTAYYRVLYNSATNTQITPATKNENGVWILFKVEESKIKHDPSTETYKRDNTYRLADTVDCVLSASITMSGKTDYPSASTQFDQRRVFAGSNQNPLRVWFTNAGRQDAMFYHVPVKDDDRIKVTAIADDADRIKHAIGASSLLLFTSSSELRVFTQNSDALTPSSIAVRAQSHIGANDVQPIQVGSEIVYIANRGGHAMTLGYSSDAGSFVASDISVRTPHLFDGYDITSITVSKAPVTIIWATSTSGQLLSCSYMPSQYVIAWAHHATDGKFIFCCSISEGDEDHVYAVVDRHVNGAWHRYLERMGNLNVPVSKANFRYLDSYQQINSSSPVNVISGLGHLEGRTVSVFADGMQQASKIVKNGAITLDQSASNIAIGLPYTSTLVTVPLSANTSDNLQAVSKSISEVFFRVSQDGDLYANSYPCDQLWECDLNNLYLKPYDDDSHLVQVSIDGSWDEEGRIILEHRNALPVEISAIVANVVLEDK